MSLITGAIYSGVTYPRVHSFRRSLILGSLILEITHPGVIHPKGHSSRRSFIPEVAYPGVILPGCHSPRRSLIPGSFIPEVTHPGVIHPWGRLFRGHSSRGHSSRRSLISGSPSSRGRLTCTRASYRVFNGGFNSFLFPILNILFCAQKRLPNTH